MGGGIEEFLLQLYTPCDKLHMNLSEIPQIAWREAWAIIGLPRIVTLILNVKMKLVQHVQISHHMFLQCIGPTVMSIKKI
jgi:hypothetical protein